MRTPNPTGPQPDPNTPQPSPGADPWRYSAPRATLVAIGLFLSGITAGVVAGRALVARMLEPYERVGLLAEVLETIDRDYLEPVDRNALIDAAARGMVAELDGQSRWLSPEQVERIRDESEGATTGLGIEFAREGGGALQVVAVDPESPAARTGVARGDRIVAVNGTPVDALDANALHAELTGGLGRDTALTVLRPGWDAPRTLTAAQGRVDRRAATAAVVDDRVVYARIEVFQHGAAGDLEAAVEAAAAPVGGVDALRGLLVDLRDNPGGLLSEAVATADLFLDQGTLVSTHVRDGVVDRVYAATPGGFPPTLRVVALVNGMSASASEIVASALQDTGRGTLVGERTFGKGTVQQVYLPRNGTDDGAALKLTVGQYFTASGAPVAPREGRTPDVVVPFPRAPTPLGTLRQRLATAEHPEREELARLVDALGDPPAVAPEIPWDQPLAERVTSDPQVRAALAVLAEPG